MIAIFLRLLRGPGVTHGVTEVVVRGGGSAGSRNLGGVVKGVDVGVARDL